jgi:glycosyltransferase involved in cell wall biosynthesis
MHSERILVCHNHYQQRGGEDSVFASEVALLRSRGHEVLTFERDNDGLELIGKFRLAKETIWSSSSADALKGIIGSFRPDIMHVHNTVARLSPSIYWVANKYKIPVIQTLHNFRLLCPQGMLLRDGAICEDCVGHIPWRGVAYGCYRSSKSQTAALASYVTVHRALGTWDNRVTRYIALNEFCRSVFIRGGLPQSRVLIKPNFVDDAFQDAAASDRSGFLYVGRLSKEKGVDILAKALAADAQIECEITGVGDLAALFFELTNAKMKGWQDAASVNEQMLRATALVMPSIWYENFPRTLVEAFAAGLPVIASRLGAMATLIKDHHTGLLFEPGNVEDLLAKMRWARSHPDEMATMGHHARAEYEANYTPDQNYAQLMDIYKDAATEVRGE